LNRRVFMSSAFPVALPLGLAGQSAGQPNEVIERARQAALNVLNPNSKDLEHGLELHAKSMVIDAYGFSPRTAIDGDAMRAAIEAGASELELQDMHEDMIMTRAVDNAAELEEHRSAWKAAGMTCIFQNP
jgi:membrane dipeptidase